MIFFHFCSICQCAFRNVCTKSLINGDSLRLKNTSPKKLQYNVMAIQFKT